MTRLPAWTPLREPGAPPSSTAPYTPGARSADGWIYTAGLVAIDAAGATIGAGDVAAQVAAIFAQARAILAAGGATLANVLSVQIFLKDLADYAAMNAAYRDAFGNQEALPPRYCIQADLVRTEWLVEIAFTARAA